MLLFVADDSVWSNVPRYDTLILHLLEVTVTRQSKLLTYYGFPYTIEVDELHANGPNHMQTDQTTIHDRTHSQLAFAVCAPPADDKVSRRERPDAVALHSFVLLLVDPATHEYLQSQDTARHMLEGIHASLTCSHALLRKCALLCNNVLVLLLEIPRIRLIAWYEMLMLRFFHASLLCKHSYLQKESAHNMQ